MVSKHPTPLPSLLCPKPVRLTHPTSPLLLSLRSILLLLPVVTLTNHPALNVDRVEVLPAVGAVGKAVLSVARYATVAYAIFGVTLYLILKFGSLERAADLSESTYGRVFYATRVVPMALLFLGFLAAGIVRRVEFSPQPIVPLVSLARNGHFGVRFPTATISATAAVGSLQIIFLIFFVVRYIIVSRRIVRMNYRQARLKVINVFFLYSHTIVPLSVCSLASAGAASLWPTPLTRLAVADHKFAEEFVLDVPYYARSGIVLVFTTWTLLEAFVSIPSAYKPTFLERVLIKRMGMQPGAAFAPVAALKNDDNDEDLEAGTLTRRHTFGLAAPKFPPKPTTILGDDGGAGAGAAVVPSDGHVVWKAPKAQSARERALTFRFDETVLAWNFSWLAYLSDDVIVRAMNDNSRTLALHRIWRESMYDQCVLMATSPDMIVVAFRGSVSAVNMKTNLHMSQTSHPPDEDPEWLKGLWKAPTWGHNSPTFHRGFSNAYGSVSASILDDLRAENERIPGRRVFCCGHSLGGALATLAAFDCRVILGVPDELVTCITFGSPRVGNTAFVRRFAVTVSDSWRVINLHDFVTNHPKRKVQQYDHVPRCALATLDGNLILDPRFADLKLMHGSSMRAHSLVTYRETLQAFVDVALAQSPPNEPFAFEPDWWNFAVYDSVEVGDDGITELHQQVTEDSSVKDEPSLDDVFEGLSRPHRAVQSLPSDTVSEREPVSFAARIRPSSRASGALESRHSRRGVLNLQWAKRDFKALDGDADLLLGVQSMSVPQSPRLLGSPRSPCSPGSQQSLL